MELMDFKQKAETRSEAEKNLENELFALMQQGINGKSFGDLVARCHEKDASTDEFYATFFKALSRFDDETESILVKNPYFGEAMRAINVPDLMIALMKEQRTNRELEELRQAV